MSTVVTKGVLDFIREVLPVPPGAGPTLIRHLIGNTSADLIKVPAVDSVTKLGLSSAPCPASGTAKRATPHHRPHSWQASWDW